MAYSATYASTDTSAVVIDVGLTVLVAIGTLATVFGIVLVWNFVRGKGFTLTGRR